MKSKKQDTWDRSAKLARALYEATLASNTEDDPQKAMDARLLAALLAAVWVGSARCASPPWERVVKGKPSVTRIQFICWAADVWDHWHRTRPPTLTLVRGDK